MDPRYPDPRRVNKDSPLLNYPELSPSLDFGNDSGSDESDGDEQDASNYYTPTNQKRGDSSTTLTLDVDTWLAELDTLTLTRDLDSRAVDPFRFSQATLEDTQEEELNAILGELTALQQSLDREIKPLDKNCPGGGQGTTGRIQNAQGSSNMNHNTKAMSTPSESGGRTESPDNDSGFSDNASLLSSGSSLSASGSSSGSSTTSIRLKPSLLPSSVIHPNEDEKAEKIRVALAKMRAASVTRLYVKAFSPDGSSKALMVEESMSCGRVLALLADKNHVPLSSKWALVEHIPHLHMERIYEDHENMVENLLMWTRDSKNKIYFVERDDKYDMFLNPQGYFGGSTSSQSLDEHGKTSLVEEFYAHGHGVPEVESSLYLKAEGKKAWKKFPFVLRASGVYYFPKGKTHANSSKDLVCLGTIDHNTQAYEGVGWKKKFKAPTEYGFVLKPARLQAKSHRHMKYLCAEDIETLKLWMVGLRIAKHGRVLWENYQSLQEDIAHEDLDRFGRSVSLASMPIQISTNNSNYHHHQVPIAEEVTTGQQRQYSTTEFISTTSTVPPPPPANHSLNGNSNGDRMVLGVIPTTLPPQPTILQTIVAVREEGFESDAPVGGTIKRKPSTVLSPKIPLTLNTRSLVSEYITPGEGNTVTLAHTLQRKRSVSGTPSTCSSSSSSSILSSPIHNNHPVGIVGKPPVHGGPSIISLSNGPCGKPLEVPASVGEETLDSLEIANLPPPPPELLEYNGCDEVNVVSGMEIPYQGPPRPNSILKLNQSGTLPNPLLRQISLESQSSTQSLPKKGVTFANELSQRLMTRNHNTNPGSTSTESILSNSIGKNLHQSPTSSPKKMEDPPPDFLTDLQRVMQKKWQVAQKCHVSNASPQEVLGFRFEPTIGPGGPTCPESPLSEECQSENGDPVNPATLNNVRAWVSQHYGGPDEPPLPPSVSDIIPANQRKPIPPVPNLKPQQQRVTFAGVAPPSYPQPPTYQGPPPSSPATNVVIYENFQGRKHSGTGSSPIKSNNYNNNHQQLQQQQQQYQVQLRNKKPPPPIPKRSDSTHLSAQFVYN